MQRRTILSVIALLLLPNTVLAATTGFRDHAWLYVMGFLALSGLIGFGQLLTALRHRNTMRATEDQADPHHEEHTGAQK